MMLRTLPVFVLVAFAHAAPDTLKDLRAWAALPHETRPSLDAQPFATAPLSKAEAARATDVLWEVRLADLKREREKEWAAKSIVLGDKTMKFEFKVFGDKPKAGRSLFISMHGGGGAPAAVNEQQWRNQIGLYTPKEGVYLAPRAPTDTWNLWHEGHIDDFFDRIITNAIVFEGVDPNRVYLMGYSAGGDGTYELAPRMADRFAAASMMAGHPNQVSPLGLRNLPFTIHVGAEDGGDRGYHRNEEAIKFGTKLDDLRKADPNGYEHFVHIHEGCGHWMKLEDREAIPWMEKFTRNPLPDKVVWHQHGALHDRFYWVAVPIKEARDGQDIIAERSGQNISVTAKDNLNITLLLNDAMLNLDEPVTVTFNGKALPPQRAMRRLAVIRRTMKERGDPGLVFSAEIKITP